MGKASRFNDFKNHVGIVSPLKLKKKQWGASSQQPQVATQRNSSFLAEMLFESDVRLKFVRFPSQTSVGGSWSFSYIS